MPDTWLRPVNDTLHVELREHFTSLHPEGQLQLAIVRQDGGIVVLELSEVTSLIDVLGQAGADLAAYGVTRDG